jgi:hypothetical protein
MELGGVPGNSPAQWGERNINEGQYREQYEGDRRELY